MTTNENIEGSERPENWDLETAEARRPARRSRAVVSVAFSRQDFETVSGKARAAGQPVSRFIREAALKEVRGDNSPSPARLGASFGLVTIYGIGNVIGAGSTMSAPSDVRLESSVTS